MSMSIIVPLDGSPFAERGLPIASKLARRSGGSITLFTGRDAGVPADIDEYLDRQAARFDIQAKHKSDDHHDIPLSLANFAAAHGDPVIVMSSRGPNGIDDVVIGSITAETLRLTDTPVLLLGPHLESGPSPTDSDYETLLVCLDGSPEAEAILPVAERWAKLLSLKVWIVQVVEPDASKIPALELGSETLNESGYVHRIATEMGGTMSIGFDVLHDRHPHHPAAAILRYAEALPRPIIAMATHGRTGLRRLAMGSVTMAVVRHATGPVLVIRPADRQN